MTTPTERRSVIARETVCLPREALDVLLIAADWAEARIEARENPLRLALINMRAALDASASAGDGLTPGEALSMTERAAVGWSAEMLAQLADHAAAPSVFGEAPAIQRARRYADVLRALVERSRP